MRFRLLIIVAVLGLVSLSARRSCAEELKSIGLDDATKIGLRIETDTNEKVEGKSSIKITTRWPTTICLGEVDGLDVENARLIYSAQIKSEVEGTAYLEMWVKIGGGEYFSRNPNDCVSKKSDWAKVTTPFLFQTGQRPEKVTLNLIVNGKGTVWVDDIKLSKEKL